MPINPLSSPALFISLIIVLGWLITLTLLFIRSERKYIGLTQGVTKKDLRSVLRNLQKNNTLTNEEINKIKQALKVTRKQAESHFQKVGFVRYNPFSDTGGNQSFCIALLDGHDNGVVISSLHSRDQTRIYAKKIADGKSPGYTLSKEERAVIKQAQFRKLK